MDAKIQPDLYMSQIEEKHMSFKSVFQTALRRLGVYQRVKSSCLYDFYWGMADHKMLERRNRELRFYRDTLKDFTKRTIIYDVGANFGDKTDIFLRLGAKVVAVDPDEFNLDILRDRFLRLRVIRKPVAIVGKAVSDQVSTKTMWVDTPGSAKNTLSRKWVETLQTDSIRFGERLQFNKQRIVETTTLDELIQSHGRPSYVKIDVEGYEVSVLKGLSTPVRNISFEVNLPEFLPEGQRCVALLETLAPGGEWNYTADCTRGLALGQWLPHVTFRNILDKCSDQSIEVFWTSPLATTDREGVSAGFLAKRACHPSRH